MQMFVVDGTRKILELDMHLAVRRDTSDFIMAAKGKADLDLVYAQEHYIPEHSRQSNLIALQIYS